MHRICCYTKDSTNLWKMVGKAFCYHETMHDYIEWSTDLQVESLRIQEFRCVQKS